MGLARDLTMGTKRKRTAPIGTTGPYAVLRRLTAKADWTDADKVAMAAAIAEVMATPGRLRFAEGAALNDACRRYHTVTGVQLGPMTVHLP